VGEAVVNRRNQDANNMLHTFLEWNRSAPALRPPQTSLWLAASSRARYTFAIAHKPMRYRRRICPAGKKNCQGWSWSSLWVSGTNGENAIEARATAQSEAWLQAVEQVRALAMLYGSRRFFA
jgi:hypothetical protein